VNWMISSMEYEIWNARVCALCNDKSVQTIVSTVCYANNLVLINNSASFSSLDVIIMDG